MSNGNIPKNGYEICKYILDVSKTPIEDLLDLSKKDETDWLEWKASAYPEGEDPSNIHNDELRWHIAKAVVTMANLNGGAILIGIDSEGNFINNHKKITEYSISIGKASTDWDSNYLNNIKKSLNKSAWKVKDKKIQTSIKLNNIYEVRQAKYLDMKVPVILVKPMPYDNKHLISIIATHSASGMKSSYLLVRQRGDVGDTVELSMFDDQIKYCTERQEDISRFSGLWNIYMEKRKYIQTKIDNLPRESPHFIGRKSEFNALLKNLSINSRTWIVTITGIGGVGKTALALEVAHHCLKASLDKSSEHDHLLSFDGFVWTSAKKDYLEGDRVIGRLMVTSTLDGIVEEILRVIAPTIHKNLPSPQKQLEKVLELLGSKRILLIIDNMEEIEDDRVISFLSDLPNPSKAIVTDRRPMHHSFPIRLTALEKPEAFLLCEGYAKESGLELTFEQVDEITARAGYIPLGIIWAIGYMASTQCSTGDVFRRIGDVNSNDLLEYIFEQSFGWISDNARLILTILSIIDSPICGRELIDWSSLPKHKATEAIGELIGYALIFADKNDQSRNNFIGSSDNKSYRVSPLTRDFVISRTKEQQPQIKSNIIKRLISYIDSQESEPEWPSVKTIDYISNMRSFYAWAVLESFNQGDYNKTSVIIKYIGHALGIRGYHDIRIKLAKIAAQAAHKIGNKRAEARSYIREIAWVYFSWHEYDKSKEATQKGFALLDIDNDELLRAIGLRTLGLIEKERHNIEQAELLLNTAMKTFADLNDRRFLAITLGSLGSLKRDQGQLSLAEDFLLQAINSVRDLKNAEELESIFYGKISKIYIKWDRFDEAIKFLEKAEKINRYIDRQVGIAYCKQSMANIYERNGDMIKAVHLVKEANELFVSFGFKKEIADDMARILSKAKAAGIETS